ncbi:MAG: precorrin-6A reductase [Hespellia sp.]|nr:precorrin-6A reductase [Hespellia sp.]
MERLLIFAGTTEGRRLAEFAEKLQVQVYVSVATEYGRESMGTYANTKIISGRMDAAEIASFLEKNQITRVVDATHPYAILVTENIRKVCREKGVPYIRCLRDTEEHDMKENENMIFVQSVKQAVSYLKNTTGNILITTGSKELAQYTELEQYQERCYARVLSTKAAIEKSIDLGFEGRHLIAMQGPFSKEMNIAMLHDTGAKYMVTKESGKIGGFGEKLEAAKTAAAKLIVVGRPRETGYNLTEVCNVLAKELTRNNTK